MLFETLSKTNKALIIMNRELKTNLNCHFINWIKRNIGYFNLSITDRNTFSYENYLFKVHFLETF